MTLVAFKTKIINETKLSHFFHGQLQIFLNIFTAVFLHFSQLRLYLSIFTFGNLFDLVFHNSAWNFLRVVYLYILRSVKIFKQRTNWKNSFWLKYHTFQKYHASFNATGGLKLQYQWKSTYLLGGLSVSVQLFEP